MIADEELFFARRLGYGLRAGESIGPDIRGWATSQISSVPALDFYGPNGTNLRSALPKFAEPVPDYKEATRLVGVYFNQQHDIDIGKASGSVDFEMRWWPQWREALVRSLTAVNGPSPVFERFWAFWVNHFAVKAEQMTGLWYGPHTRLIRSHMTDKFGDMLQDAILQPAMLYFLDNFNSAGPHSPSALHGPGETINENLGRELLELHTMSPAGGYTQKDVVELAYALSGWGFYAAQFDDDTTKLKNPPPFGARFFSDKHEPGTRKILGKSYGKANKGRDQASAIIADLAVNPATAQFISWKLVRHFVADEPPEDSVARIKDAWMQSGGDLVTIHTAVIDEVIAKAPDHEKFTTPINWLHQLHRTAAIPIPMGLPKSGTPWISVVCDELGQGYDTVPQPDGFSDLKAEWISKELLERRVRYANIVAPQITEETLPYLADFGARLAGPNSDLVAALKNANSPAVAAIILLASPQFMRI